MPEEHVGGRLAARYDESSAEMFAPGVVEPAVHFLAQLAGDGAALELGIGTGRIALPLAQRGVCPRARNRPVGGDGRAAARQAGRRQGRRDEVTPTHLGFDEYDVVSQGLIS